MRKRNVIVVALALFLMGCASLPLAAAQDTAKGKEEEVQLKPTDSYKVEFTVNEMDNGKKINSRSYLMLARADALPKWTNRQQLRVGSKVPIPVGTGTGVVQYQDVVMYIDCRFLPMGNGKVTIDITWDYGSFGIEEGIAHGTQPPVLRQVRSSVEAVVPIDKPTVIAEMDDGTSTHRFVFEVKVTKINP
jgi:hypothetical protein